MTWFSCTSSQARTQRSHRMHALWSTWKTGDVESSARRPACGWGTGAGSANTSSLSRSTTAQARVATLASSLYGANSFSNAGGDAALRWSAVSSSESIFTLPRTRSPSLPGSFMVNTSMPSLT